MALIDPVKLKTLLADVSSRFDVDALEACDSTNSEVMRRAAQGAPSGTVVVADRQGAGRGRRGRPWLSSPENSLTFSLLWRLQGQALAGLSLAIGVAITRALKRLGATDVCLKWPNDVLFAQDGGFAKLAGILIELSSDRRGVQVVIGIGLNLSAPLGDLPQPAAGLDQACPTHHDRHQVLAVLLMELAGLLDAFAVNGFVGLRAEWEAHHAWQNRDVVVLDDAAEPLRGRCVGVDDDGSLLLAGDAGLLRVLAGDVSLRQA